MASEYGWTIEQFLDLTMRQLVAMIEKIRIRNTTKEYWHLKFFASLHGAEMPSIDSILGVASNEESSFSEEDDKAMEAHALALLAQKKAAKRV